MNCCGAQEYKDWTNTSFSRPNDAVPDSCCLSDVEGCGKDILTMSDEQARERPGWSKRWNLGCLNSLQGPTPWSCTAYAFMRFAH